VIADAVADGLVARAASAPSPPRTSPLTSRWPSGSASSRCRRRCAAPVEAPAPRPSSRLRRGRPRRRGSRPRRRGPLPRSPSRRGRPLRLPRGRRGCRGRCRRAAGLSRAAYPFLTETAKSVPHSWRTTPPLTSRRCARRPPPE
jgi:hypothetical protein